MAINVYLNMSAAHERNHRRLPIVRSIAILTISLLALTSCSTNDQSPTPEPSANSLPAGTESPTKTETPTNTSTPRPTATNRPPTNTPIPEPILTPTSTQTPQLSPPPLSKLPIGTPIPADPTATISPSPTALPTTTPSPAPTQLPPTATLTPTSTPLPTGPIPNISAVPAFPNLHYATFGDNTVLLTYPPDGTNRVAVVEKEGKISIFENSAAINQVKTFLDIRSQVALNGNEEGVLGLAFHPDYAQNGHLYVYYSAANPRRSILSRFTVSQDPDFADQSTELEIMEVPQPYSNHNGGMIEFGPDGYLYIGLGDGGSSDDPRGNGQNTSTLLGSIVRIDVDNPAQGKNYGIPSDNPFASSANGPSDPRPEIYAYGLRNPWRFSFDRITGELWVGDVGQDKWEEIDIVRNGGNYGWNITEGNHCFRPSSGCDTTGLTLPIAEYDHSGRCSITGGYVYRGGTIPELHGVYIYTDFCSGEIWGIRTNTRTTPQLLATGYKWSPSFGEDAEGNLYILTLGAPVQRIVLAN